MNIIIGYINVMDGLDLLTVNRDELFPTVQTRIFWTHFDIPSSFPTPESLTPLSFSSELICVSSSLCFLGGMSSREPDYPVLI